MTETITRSGRRSTRSLHELPTPRLGGLAILAGVVAASLIWLPWNAETRAILTGASGHFCDGADLQGAEDATFATLLQGVLDRLVNVAFPTMAAIEGAARN